MGTLSYISTMINVNDLRVDNWVMAPKTGLCQVNGIQLHGDKKTYVWVVADGMEFQHRVEIKKLDPVGLTNEILEKAGFIKGPYDFYIWRGKQEFSITFNDHNEAQLSVGEAEYNVGRKIKYLHELQNLYFALIGEELNIQSC